jgi:hypothetical protein
MTELKLKVGSPEMAAAIIMVLTEMERAIHQHPKWPTDNVKRAAIVLEESGELIREANRIDEGVGSLDELKNECIQTAAMCFRMLDALAEDRAELVANYGPYGGEH